MVTKIIFLIIKKVAIPKVMNNFLQSMLIIVVNKIEITFLEYFILNEL